MPFLNYPSGVTIVNSEPKKIYPPSIHLSWGFELRILGGKKSKNVSFKKFHNECCEIFDKRRKLSSSSAINPILANVPILYSLKTLENQRFPGVFREYKMGTLARNGLRYFLLFFFWVFDFPIQLFDLTV